MTKSSEKLTDSVVSSMVNDRRDLNLCQMDGETTGGDEGEWVREVGTELLRDLIGFSGEASIFFSRELFNFIEYQINP